MKTIAYLRVSTQDQDLDKFKTQVLDYASRMSFGRPRFVQEKISGKVDWRKRALGKLVESLGPGDKLLVPELSRLGRSLPDILDVLRELTNRDVAVYSIKENFQLNGDDIQSKVMRTLLGLFAEIERDLIVARTKEGLQAARVRGVQLGRPKGSKLDKSKNEILASATRGKVSMTARKYNVTPSALRYWLTMNA